MTRWSEWKGKHPEAFERSRRIRKHKHVGEREHNNEANARCRFKREYPEIPAWLLEARLMAWRFRRMARGDYGYDGLGVS